MTRARVVVIGAGIAGVSAAYHLSVRHGVSDVVIIDPRPPLTLTSDKSTECYRNWWPDPSMVGLMNHSIDLMEELARDIDFGLNRRGYLFVTANQDTLAEMCDQVVRTAQLGAGADILESDALSTQFPFITEDALGGVQVHRAGWLSAQQFGQSMLEQARESGVRVIAEVVNGLEAGKVTTGAGTTLPAEEIVIAAGPMAAQVAGLAEIDLPLFSELHLKVVFRDHLGVIPRDAPMTIWSDVQHIAWGDDERDELEKAGRLDVLGEMPVFCHFRPEGGGDSPFVAALWEYDNRVVDPVWPIPTDPLYPEVVIRGLTTMVPGLEGYRDRLPHSVVDGGYYTKTRENRPLIGPSPGDGIHLLCGLSGFGVMAAPGAGDLVARHITGETLPEYADAFLMSRYEDPAYLSTMLETRSGQL